MKFRTPMMVLVICTGFFLVIFQSHGQRKLNIFNPDMKPVAGDWEKPVHQIGETPKKMWSESTVGAAVNNRPLGGKSVKRVGEIIDVSCYVQLGKHGQPHEGCGKACVLNGYPIGLLDASGNVYLLFGEEHESRQQGTSVFAKAMVNHMGHVEEVRGTYTIVNGMRAIYIQGFVKK